MALVAGLVLQLFRESSKRLLTSGRADHARLAVCMDEYQRDVLIPLFHRAQRGAHRQFTLCFVGLTNTGKSTLVHALFGQPLAPVRNGPATAVPVEYEYAEIWRTKVVPTAGMINCNQFSDVGGVLRHLQATVLAPERREASRIEKVIVQGPLSLLGEGLRLADTPGIGAADLSSGEASSADGTAGPADGEHDEIVRKYLTDGSVDQIYFCVASGNAVVTPRELESYKCVRDKVSHVVITKAKEWISDAEAMEEYRMRYGPLFQRPLIFVEAKAALTGGGHGKTGQSNIHLLHDVISRYQTSELRMKWSDAEAAGAIEDFVERQRYLARATVSQGSWEPTCWRRVQQAIAQTGGR